METNIHTDGRIGTAWRLERASPVQQDRLQNPAVGHPLRSIEFNAFALTGLRNHVSVPIHHKHVWIRQVRVVF